MAFGRRCSLCGGKLDSQLRCMECGLDNTKNDEMYRGMLNRNKCDGEPLTHVHDESKRNSVKTYTTKSRSSTAQNRGSSPSKKIGRVIGIVIIVTWILPMVFEIIGSMMNTHMVEEWIEEISTETYNYEQYLEPGYYTVGVHIPEGTYDIEILDGNYGDIEIYEYIDGIVMMKDFYFLDGDYEDQSYVEALYLEEGDILSISPNLGIMISSYEELTFVDLYVENNPLSQTYMVTGSAVAGVDFPAGVYDIYYEPYLEDEYGTVGFSIWSEEKQANMFTDELYVDSYMGEVYFKNVPLTKESQIWLTDLETITLIPSSELDPQMLSISGESL